MDASDRTRHFHNINVNPLHWMVFIFNFCIFGIRSSFNLLQRDLFEVKVGKGSLIAGYLGSNDVKAYGEAVKQTWEKLDPRISIEIIACLSSRELDT